jgi:L-ascorbate metabolism protein UlaG (beta-lactamase superfamily)
MHCIVLLLLLLYHNRPQEALTLHSDVRSKRSFGIHWGTFPLASDTHLDAPRALVRALRQQSAVQHSEFELLQHGETLVAGQQRRYSCKWHAEPDDVITAEASGEL